MAEKIRINSTDYYALKYKLWVETMAVNCGRIYTGNSSVTPRTAAMLADEAVAEFEARFRSV